MEEGASAGLSLAGKGGTNAGPKSQPKGDSDSKKGTYFCYSNLIVLTLIWVS